MQKGRRKLREQKKGMLTIGFSIYEVQEGLQWSEVVKIWFMYI